MLDRLILRPWFFVAVLVVLTASTVLGSLVFEDPSSDRNASLVRGVCLVILVLWSAYTGGILARASTRARSENTQRFMAAMTAISDAMTMDAHAAMELEAVVYVNKRAMHAMQTALAALDRASNIVTDQRIAFRSDRIDPSFGVAGIATMESVQDNIDDAILVLTRELAASDTPAAAGGPHTTAAPAAASGTSLADAAVDLPKPPVQTVAPEGIAGSAVSEDEAAAILQGRHVGP